MTSAATGVAASVAVALSAHQQRRDPTRASFGRGELVDFLSDRRERGDVLRTKLIRARLRSAARSADPRSGDRRLSLTRDKFTPERLRESAANRPAQRGLGHRNRFAHAIGGVERRLDAPDHIALLFP